MIKKIDQKSWVGILGIILSLVGTIYLSQATFGFNGGWINASDGRKFDQVYSDDILLRISLIVISIGFVIQLLEKIWDRIPPKSKSYVFNILLTFFALSLLYVSIYRFFGIDILLSLRLFLFH
jgi:hypothetical protein